MRAALETPTTVRRGDAILKLQAISEKPKFQKSLVVSEIAENQPPAADWHAKCYNTNLTRAQGLSGGQIPLAAVGRGGARNRADRESHALTEAQVLNLRAAIAHANAIGLPLNRWITVHWERAGISLDGLAKATGRFLDLLGQTIARHGGKSAWAWVHENSYEKGGHLHVLAHVPADLVAVTTKRGRGWIKRITGRRYKDGVIVSKPVGGWLGVENTCPDHHAHNLAVLIDYVSKGANAEARARLAIERQKPGGRIIGKRCGVSQNIGPKARQKQMEAFP